MYWVEIHIQSIVEMHILEIVETHMLEIVEIHILNIVEIHILEIVEIHILERNGSRNFDDKALLWDSGERTNGWKGNLVKKFSHFDGKQLK